jgi:hypothetical protein
MEVMAVDYSYLHFDSCMEVRVKDYKRLSVQYHTYHVPNFLCIAYLVIHHCNDELKIKTNLNGVWRSGGGILLSKVMGYFRTGNIMVSDIAFI